MRSANSHGAILCGWWRTKCIPGWRPKAGCPVWRRACPEQVITVGSLSKSHSMPGLRAGWLVGPSLLVKHAEALSHVHAVRFAGFHSGGGDHGARAIRRRRNRGSGSSAATRREQLLAGLDGTPGIRCSIPDAGMFTLIDVRGTGLSGNEFMHGLYRAERVSVIDGGAFGTETRGFVRLCFATDEATLSEGVVRIRRHAASLTR